MARFRMVLHEELQTIVEVEADSLDEARDIVEEQWDNGEIGIYGGKRNVTYHDHEIWED